jgi:hypothetical protein
MFVLPQQVEKSYPRLDIEHTFLIVDFELDGKRRQGDLRGLRRFVTSANIHLFAIRQILILSMNPNGGGRVPLAKPRFDYGQGEPGMSAWR